MIKKNRGKTIEELSEASKVHIEHMFNSHEIVVQSGASIQEHQKKEIHTLTETKNSAVNKTTISCTIYPRRLFSCFKKTKFEKSH